MTAQKSPWLIEAPELAELLKSGRADYTLVDVREPEEFQEIHIPGCKLIPLGELQARARSELNPNQEIILYCAHGVRSMHALMGLKSMGFAKLKSLTGGIATWQEQGYSTTPSRE